MIGISGLTSASHHLIELFELHLLQIVIVLQLITAMRMNVVLNLDWLQSLKQFFINMSYHILVAESNSDNFSSMCHIIYL